jgi:hypothetical protein
MIVGLWILRTRFTGTADRSRWMVAFAA